MLSPTHEYFPLSTTSGMFSNLIHTTRIVSNGFFLLYESEGWRKICVLPSCYLFLAWLDESTRSIKINDK